MKFIFLLIVFTVSSFALSCSVGTPCYTIDGITEEEFFYQSMLAGNLIGGTFLYIIIKLFE